ncbi:hypothetical protein SmJEL517_g03545 [Synchytrium microbalum]|uniref:Tryptophan synthase beta chain-like PALP domain-containing protein n=1 Tax=Synchytrium microbalum TaxID=1806994 RepID=A0A507C3E6_9FUNG|nr:uncharacterized protein SmJEL517_g03545 [Synchytrium microbalum]TPX33569.1 hypothetical protein SmJEL517_g03545 [Synchytrium microbalum]
MAKPMAAAIRAASRTYMTTGLSLETSNGLIGAIGNTPLIRLSKLSQETGCDILGKAEFMNPGGSVKDRAALYVVKDAEERGLIKPGGTIVEGTAGNTGIGLAHMLGADVRPVPAVAFTEPTNYNHQARDYAKSIPNAVWTNQFDNTANRRAHIETTGPEIWKQTAGTVDAFTCATGTGGTLAGTARFLKEVSRGRVRNYLADPPGSVLNQYKTNGVLERTGTTSITEGIGQGRLTDNLKDDIEHNVDEAFTVPDEESIKMVFRLLDEEGLFVGASSALNVCAAVEVAKRLGPGHRIATIICDGAYRYQSRLFSRKWIESKGLLNAIPEHLHKYISLA